MKKLHIWLSMPAGIIISIVCLTGAIMVFEREILEMAYPSRYFVQQTGPKPMPKDSIIAKVNAQLKNDTVKSIRIYPDLNRTVEATLTSGPKSYIYINPYTAQITGAHNSRKGFFHKVMILHRWLMLPNRTVGKVIVGLSTIFMIAITFSGIWRWGRARQYRVRWLAKFLRRTFDLHRVLGLYATIILVICAFTGLMWSFEWYRSAAAWLFGVESSGRKEMMRFAYSLHTGAWGGYTTKWLTFFAALIGASLPITGYILYFRRKLRKRWGDA